MYTNQDAVRCSKEVTAAMTHLHASIRHVATVCGTYLAVMDDLSCAPLNGSAYTHSVSKAIDSVSDSYGTLRDALCNLTP